MRIAFEGMAMVRSELALRISELNPHLNLGEVNRVVNTIFEEMSAGLAGGMRIELRNFGSFSIKRRSARAGRNPKTGAAVEVPGKAIPFFRTGKHLHLRLNEDR